MTLAVYVFAQPRPKVDARPQRHCWFLTLSLGADLGAPIKMSRSSSAVSADWVNIREAVLRRDNYKCLECGIPCHAAEADVHHLLPRSAGGTDEPSNLVT